MKLYVAIESALVARRETGVGGSFLEVGFFCLAGGLGMVECWRRGHDGEERRGWWRRGLNEEDWRG